MQLYVDIYSQSRYSTCFGCHAPIIRSTTPQDSLIPVRIRPRRQEVTVPLPWRTPVVADTVFSTPDDGCMAPETCRVTWLRINVYIQLHRVGPLLTLNHDAWNHVFKIYLIYIYIYTEWPKKMYTLFTHQYLWNKLWQCLDADGGHFEHLHWIQNSRTSLISILLLYKYSSYDYRVIFFMSKCVYIILGHSVYIRDMCI